MTHFNSTTTLARIRAASPCREGWEKLLSKSGKTNADDEPLPLLTVLDFIGLDDTLWVLSYAMPDDRLARHFQAWCAEQVLHLYEKCYPGDDRVRRQIAMLRNDEASTDDRNAANAAADTAAGAAYHAAGAAYDAASAASAVASAAYADVASSAASAAYAAYAAVASVASAADVVASAASAAEAAAYAAYAACADAYATYVACAATRANQERQLRAMIGGAA